MTGCGEFIFPVAVIDVAILPELRCGMFCCLHQPTACRLQCLVAYFEQVHVIPIHSVAAHCTNPMLPQHRRDWAAPEVIPVGWVH
jgi:hypothetical protein